MWGYSFYLDLRLELSTCLKLFVNFLWIVWYHSQNKVFWHELFVWLKEHLVFICRQIHSYYVKYIRPPGVKNYTYFSLDEKRPHLNHQSLLTGGWLSRINFGIFLLLRDNGCWPALSNGFQRFQPLALLMQVNGSVLWAETPTYWTRPVVPEQETACSAS